MKIIWSVEAKTDLLSIFTYIAEQDLEVAQKQKDAILDSLVRLIATPNIGRPGRVPGTRELVIPNTKFIIPYRIKFAKVEIIRVFHSSQNWGK